MNNKGNEIKNRDRTSFAGQARRNVYNKGVIVGIAIALGFFTLGTLSAWKSDFQYRKQIKNRVKNG